MLVGCDGNKLGVLVSLCFFFYDNLRGGFLKILFLGFNGFEVIF